MNPRFAYSSIRKSKCSSCIMLTTIKTQPGVADGMICLPIIKLVKNKAGFRGYCLANTLSVEIAFPGFWGFSNQERLKIMASITCQRT